MAVSQDFEARRRERLKKQHKKRERERKIQRIVLLIAIAFLAFLLIFNIVNCSSKKKKANNAQISTQTTQSENEKTNSNQAEFDPSIPKPKAGKNNYLDIIKDSGQTNHVYLTFDNGPSEEVTPAILDVLRRYNVKATFFMNGKDIKDNPHLCTRAMEEGHLVLPLSKSGSADILYADKTTFMDEVNETYDMIVDCSPTDQKPIKLYRFLGGSYENSSFGEKKQRYKDDLAEDGYYYCDWNSTVGDSTTSRTSEQLLTYFNNNVPDVNNLVIQLNNTDKNTATVNMLGGLIEKLLGEEYIFSRLDEIEFENEIEYEDEEILVDELDDNNKENEDEDEDDDNERPKSTKSPSSTVKPAATAKPKATTPPAATQKPVVATPKPTQKANPVVTQRPQPIITPPPAVATLPPDVITSE